MSNRRNIYQDLEEDVIEKDPQFPEEFGAERTAVVQLDGLVCALGTMAFVCDTTW